MVAQREAPAAAARGPRSPCKGCGKDEGTDDNGEGWGQPRDCLGCGTIDRRLHMLPGNGGGGHERTNDCRGARRSLGGEDQRRTRRELLVAVLLAQKLQHRALVPLGTCTCTCTCTVPGSTAGGSTGSIRGSAAAAAGASALVGPLHFGEAQPEDRGLAGAIQRLDPSALTLALGRVLEHDVELPSTWATELLGKAHPYLPAVCGVLPRAFTMEMLELWWCEFGHRFDECMRQEANPCRLAMVSRSSDSPNANDRVYTTSGSRLLRAGLSVPRTEWHEGRTRVREFDLSTALPASDLCLSDVPELTYAELCGYRLPLSPPS